MCMSQSASAHVSEIPLSNIFRMQLYSLAQMEGKWVSCSSLDRRISALFFTWVSAHGMFMWHSQVPAICMNAATCFCLCAACCRGSDLRSDTCSRPWVIHLVPAGGIQCVPGGHACKSLLSHSCLCPSDNQYDLAFIICHPDLM